MFNAVYLVELFTYYIFYLLGKHILLLHTHRIKSPGLRQCRISAKPNSGFRLNLVSCISK